jgi:hypothetical protein
MTPLVLKANYIRMGKIIKSNDVMIHDDTPTKNAKDGRQPPREQNVHGNMINLVIQLFKG